MKNNKDKGNKKEKKEGKRNLRKHKTQIRQQQLK